MRSFSGPCEVAMNRELSKQLAGITFIAALLAPAVVPSQAQDASDMVKIPAGTYFIGSSDGPASAQPRHAVNLTAFLIDKYEITNAQFAHFLNSLEIKPKRDIEAGALSASDVSGPDARRVWRTGDTRFLAFIELDDSDAQIGIYIGRFAPGPGHAQRPVPESTWAGARAYCNWRGARLPTEAEWEAAARGKQERIYPWGNSRPTPELAVFARSKGQTAPVNSHRSGTTPDGIHHLAGNMAEWTSSLFKPYPYDSMDGREAPDLDGERTTRGGDHVFDVEADKLKTYFRDGFSRNPNAGHRHIGFRCAKD